MATNVLLPLSSSGIGRNGVALSGDPAPRGRQRSKEPGHSPVSPVNLSFPGSVMRREKGEDMNRTLPKPKEAIRSITREIDPSRCVV